MRRHWQAKSASPATISRQLPEALRGDFRLIWSDFSIIAHSRLLQGSEVGDYSGQQLIVLAHSRTSLDLVFSKWGYAEATRQKHHFFHWQARAAGVQGAVNVDDYLAAA